MEIFNNGQRSGYEEIVASGPGWWTEYREMDAVYRYEGWLLDMISHFTKRLINNQFPGHADEASIRMYESLMNVEYDPGATIEERRQLVSAYYAGTGKLSKSIIQDIIKKYSGLESEIYWDGEKMKISIKNEAWADISIQTIKKILSRRMPAHISFDIFEEHPVTGYVYVGAVMQQAEIINIRQVV
ncbi:DUF2313 domain-containing protein [Anaerotruncus sp. 1XD22-93]|nr:DUF2313 domain-containing protein [Lachnospiraceae bacterium]NBI76569.1 DUF2313 domain-containing protein [Lachnospiraceae bacterium]RKJ79287.1 DUF2313 domain-containing protein [Anaerotruncus sp. 1XD22-93]